MKQEDFNQWKGINDIQIPAGKTITLQVLGIIDDPLPENKGQKIIPNALIRPTCAIFRDGKTYNIAAIDTVDMSGNVSFARIIISGASAGFLKLKSGVPRDENWWKFLSLCDENESNPDRNTDVEAKFKVLDIEKDANELYAEKEAAFNAQSLVFGLEESAVRAIAKTLKVEGISVSVLKNKLLELAAKSPGSIFEANEAAVVAPAAAKKEVADILGPIKEALAKGILRDERELKQILFGPKKEVVFTYVGNKVKEKELLDHLEAEKPEVLAIVLEAIGK